ncbi:MAG TPA: 2-amino-4-hydroxy-6-hydroxymethyldihydropteridine diphosphokinase [Candidatus Acidoferrum sp.]|jgi:2-amino-4-hydroxy-6-hydroxymethyldihydropteridine diphosphokinase
MKAMKVYLALGSNVGEREKNLQRAIAALAGAGVRVTRASSIYETEPVDYLEQPWFLNCVVEAETELPPVELLRALRGIENAMGSKKEFAKGPRLIDLDILFYGDEIVDERELQVPHPRMAQRRFVLAPLAEIAAGVRDPRTRKTVAEMLEESGDRSEVKKISSTAIWELGIH